LLAGLFGSAFVPVANAAAGVPVFKLGAAAAAGTNLLQAGYVAATEAGTAALPLITIGTTAESLTIDVSELKDEFGTLVTGTVSLAASGDVVFVAGGTASYNAGLTAGSALTTADIVVSVAGSSATVYGTGSVTISIGGASTTVYYDVVGPLASIVLTNGDEFTHLAAGANGTADKLTYVEKDGAGSIITASAVTAVSQSKDAATAVDVPAATAAGNYVLEGTAAGKLRIDAASCLAADAGKTRTVAIKIGTITSNTIQWICTLAGTSAVLTGAELADTTLYAGGSSKVTYTFTDGTRKLGFGAAIGAMAVAAVDFPNSFDTSSTVTSTKSTMGTWDATGLVVDKNGQATSVAAVVTAAAKVAVGARLVVLSIADSDLGATTDVAKEIRLSYSIIDESVTGATLVAGPKAKKATATFGASAANKKVAFTLENASTGVVKTYYRKANASGVATFTLRFRGTFDVTAAYGDELTDTVELKK
jgi:hypothetical protein